MSINVTVSGNPVCIKRGKMVTIDSRSSKEEFDKRRLLRLEQVRQQSKDIADNVRNKVRREKMKQVKKIEEEGQEKLKNWKNRKLLELQSQYMEALKDFGSGHKEAKKVESELEDFEKAKLHNKKISLERAKEAAQNLQIEKNQENLKKSTPLQYKKLSRDIENTRANLVSNMRKAKSVHKKKKKKPNDINIILPDSLSPTDHSSSTEIDHSTSTDIENVSPFEDMLQPSSQERREGSEYPREPLIESENVENIAPPSSPIHHSNLKLKEIRTSQSPQIDTRISDRIKRRELEISQPDYCDNIIGRDQTLDVVSNVQIRKASLPQKGTERIFESHRDFHCCKCCCRGRCDKPRDAEFVPERKQLCKSCTNSEPQHILTTQPSLKGDQKSHLDRTEEKWKKNRPHPTEIPSKPPIFIKDIPSEDSHLIQESRKYNKVQYYDHSNRFVIERDVPSSSYVEKLTADSTEVIPNIISENELLEQMKRRDKEVQMRGKKALATERVKRDYEQMLKKLPILQKKEKILELKKDKPVYHMPEERLKEIERTRQNKLENAFNKVYSNLKPAVITLPKLNREIEKGISERVIDGSVQSLDLNKWDTTVEEPKVFSTQEVQDIVKAFSLQKPADRRVKLKELLRSLKLQKNELIKEIKAMSQSQDESMNALINDLNSFESDDKMAHKQSKKNETEKSNRKRGRTESGLFCETTESSSSSSGERQRRRRKEGGTKQKVSLKSTHTPHKRKSKNRPKVIILQNTSTQTTPKCQMLKTQENFEVVKEEHSLKETNMSSKICKKQHIPCECKNEPGNPDELCRILINLDAEKPPAVIVERDKHSMKEKVKKDLKNVETHSVGVGTDKWEKTLPVQTDKIAKGTKLRTKENFKEHADVSKEKKPINNTIKKRTNASWKEHLSKNSNSTSSTSYMSPPDFHKLKDTDEVNSTTRRSFYDLRNKPQQNNHLSTVISSMERSKFEGLQSVKPQLVAYVEKLLGMSRASIENLNVSSTSSVTTPSQSLIELESNNPNANLQDLVRLFIMKVGNIAKELSYSPDKTSAHFNTSISTSEESQKSLEKIHSDAGKVINSVDVQRETSKQAILDQYAEITDSCSKRIASLAAMIQQIRKEKVEMLQYPLSVVEQVKSPVYSDKELSTAYMDLPDLKESKNNQQSSASSSSTSLSSDGEEILKKLLEVDLSLANKLKKLKSSEIGRNSRISQGFDDIGESNFTTTELQRRLEGLLQPKQLSDSENATKITPEEQKQPFLSFLSDIPKLPKFEANMTNEPIVNHKRPPPSKGLSIVKKFNENISLVPHELSTIVEADSQLSARVGSALPSPTTSKSPLSLSPLKDVELKIFPQNTQETVSQLPAKVLDKTDDTESVDRLSVSKQCANRIDSSNASTTHSKSGMCELSCSKTSSRFGDTSKQYSSSSDDIETIESMLRSIGMEWAIPTLHKTREALALSSSSSSPNLSLKNKLLDNDSNGSDTSLKALLSRRLNKISSSTSITDGTPVSLLRELSDLSAIQANSKERQRTSTPLTASKTTSKSRDDVFSMESDLSSVKNATS